jgi:hypothetical protein
MVLPEGETECQEQRYAADEEPRAQLAEMVDE